MEATPKIVTKKEIREGLFMQCLGLIIREGPIKTPALVDRALDNEWVLPWSLESQRRSGLGNLFHSILQPHNNKLIRNGEDGWELESRCDNAVRVKAQNRRLRDTKGRLISVGEDIEQHGTSDRIQDDLQVLIELFRDLIEEGCEATPEV
jgi:hypothetical protein